MPAPFNYLPWLNALLCLGMGLYVLSRNWRTWANVGFGIGLYQVKGIVEAHGGKIERTPTEPGTDLKPSLKTTCNLS